MKKFNVDDDRATVKFGDYKDLLITDLSDENHGLRVYIAELEADMGTYRELAVAGFDALHHLAVQHQKLTTEHARVVDDYRRFREDSLIRGGADDV